MAVIGRVGLGGARTAASGSGADPSVALTGGSPSMAFTGGDPVPTVVLGAALVVVGWFGAPASARSLAGLGGVE